MSRACPLMAIIQRLVDGLRLNTVLQTTSFLKAQIKQKKSSDRITIIAGSTAAGHPVPPYFQLKSVAEDENKRIQTAFIKGLPILRMFMITLALLVSIAHVLLNSFEGKSIFFSSYTRNLLVIFITHRRLTKTTRSCSTFDLLQLLSTLSPLATPEKSLWSFFTFEFGAILPYEYGNLPPGKS